MTTTTVKRTCDVCGKEMGTWDHGKLNLSYSVTDWAGNGAPAGIKFADLCDNCCEKIHQAIVDTANSLKR